MSVSYREVIEDVNRMVHGLGSFQEQTTWTTATMDSDDVTMTVNDASQLKIGLAEVEDELIYITNVPDATTVNIAPFGRGYMGTVAAAHGVNVKVVNHPVMPRFHIKVAITDCIRGLFPMLYQVKSTNFTYEVGRVNYPLPADLHDILTVEWLRSDSSEFWEPMLEWDLEEAQDATLGAEAVKQLALLETAFQGATVRVTYITDFGEFADENAAFSTIGMPDSYRDMIAYCAAGKLARSLDMGRLQHRHVENFARSQYVAVGDGYKIGAGWDQEYQKRLFYERIKLLDQYPPRPNFSR